MVVSPNLFHGHVENTPAPLTVPLNNDGVTSPPPLHDDTSASTMFSENSNVHPELTTIPFPELIYTSPLAFPPPPPQVIILLE